MQMIFSESDKMKFHKTDNHVENQISNRVVSENGLVEIGTHEVMFGFRVRAGFVGDAGCALDWCAGDSWENIERLYSVCYNILEQRNEDRSCFWGLPSYSDIKPFFNDPKFMESIHSYLDDNYNNISLLEQKKGEFF